MFELSTLLIAFMLIFAFTLVTLALTRRNNDLRDRGLIAYRVWRMKDRAYLVIYFAALTGIIIVADNSWWNP